MTERTELDWVIEARQGSRDAFARLIEACLPMMNRIALRMVNTPDAAQDVVQEAMLQAFLSLKDLRSPPSFRSWLYGIVLNVAKSNLREIKRQSRFDHPFEDEQTAGSSAAGALMDPQQSADETELHQRVLQAIEELPAAYQEAARLFYYELLTLHEIAAITGASRGAIKVRLHRARNHLRQRLAISYPEMHTRIPQTKRKKAMVKTNVVDIVKKNDVFIVLLQEEGGERVLPIWVGPFEGTSIAIGLRAYPLRRPQTFDFMAHLLDILGVELEEARVEVLKDEVFYGVAKIRGANGVKEVDARPSDVIALAVRTASPIYVADEVMRQAGKHVSTYEEEFGLMTPGEGMNTILKEFDELHRKPHPPSESQEDEAPAP